MSEEDLRCALDALRAEMERTSCDEGRARELLEALRAEVDERLAADSCAPAGEEPGLADRLAAAAAAFEESHPRLAASVRSVMEMLDTMGL